MSNEFWLFAPIVLGIAIQYLQANGIVKREPVAWALTVILGALLYWYGTKGTFAHGPAPGDAFDRSWAFVSWLVQAAGWSKATSAVGKGAVAMGADSNHPLVPTSPKEVKDA